MNVELWGPNAWGIMVEQLVKKNEIKCELNKGSSRINNNVNAMDDETMVAYSLWQKKLIWR